MVRRLCKITDKTSDTALITASNDKTTRMLNSLHHISIWQVTSKFTKRPQNISTANDTVLNLLKRSSQTS